MTKWNIFFIGIFFCVFSDIVWAQTERKLTFQSSNDDAKLHGTLTLPSKMKGAVLMIVGSGKADRDETVPGALTYSEQKEKLFLQLSKAIVSSGYATFRYDKRGVLDESGNVDNTLWKTADREHLISDAVDAAKRMVAETNVPVENIIILGHSEGTIVSVETALALGTRVKALLLFGAQARSMRDMLHFQIVEANLTKNSTKKEREQLEVQFKDALKFIRNSKADFAPDGKPLNWYRQFLEAPANKDRAPLVNGKFVFFQGSLDRQTPTGEIEMFLGTGLRNPTVFTYPGLGHGFSREKNGKPTLGPIDAKVQYDLSNFLNSL